MIKGINVLGTDKDEESIKQSEKNIEWVKNTYRTKAEVKIMKQNVKGLAYVVSENSVHGVVTEPYMGPYIRLLPNMREAQELVVELTQLYMDLFVNLKRIVKKGGKVVIVIPRFKTRENKTVFIDFKSIIDTTGFGLVNQPIDYGYQDSKLLRQIYVLEKI
jgi:tRNA G10  N-methylase Trm11